MTALKKRDPKGHFDPVVIDNGAAAYCMKEDTRCDGPWTFGKQPMKNTKTDWDSVR